jgi:hypothetical protein
MLKVNIMYIKLVCEFSSPQSTMMSFETIELSQIWLNWQRIALDEQKTVNVTWT